MNTETVLQGLYITGMGMLIVFAALTLVMLAIMALDRVFRARMEETPEIGKMSLRGSEGSPPPVAETASLPLGSMAVSVEPGIVAAVAVALALRLQETGALGKREAVAPAPVHVISLKDEAGLWAAVGKLG